MTRQEILEKAIQKAIEGGYDLVTAQDFIEIAIQNSPKLPDGITRNLFYITIFDKEFARCLWSDNTITVKEDAVKVVQHQEDEPTTVIIAHTAWQYHLQQMVIADDPIQYLGEHS